MPTSPGAQPCSGSPGARPPRCAERGRTGVRFGDRRGQVTGTQTTTTADAAPKAGASAQVDLAGTAGARAAGTAPPGTSSGGFMDARLTWTFGDDDFTQDG